MTPRRLRLSTSRHRGGAPELSPTKSSSTVRTPANPASLASWRRGSRRGVWRLAPGGLGPAVLLACSLVVACDGSPTWPMPVGRPPAPVERASVTLVSVQPPSGAGVLAPSLQQLKVQLSCRSDSDASLAPLFLVGSISQTDGLRSLHQTGREGAAASWPVVESRPAGQAGCSTDPGTP